MGLDLGIQYTALYQRASEGNGPREGSGGDLDILGAWHLIGSKEKGNEGIDAFRGEWRHKYTNIPPAQLRNSIGSLWSTTDGFNVQDFTMKEVWWEQHLFADRFIVRGGKVSMESYLDVYRYQSASTGFSNFAFSNRPTIAIPGQGLGIIAGYFPRKDMYVGAEVADANGRKKSSGLNTIKEDEYFSAAEVGITPRIPGLGKGKYHVSVWHIDARKKRALSSGDGFSVNLLQEIGNGLVPFIRYGYANKGSVALRHLLTFGLGIEKPLGRTSDLMGMAFAWSQAQNKALPKQSVFEVFYRLQLTPNTR